MLKIGIGRGLVSTIMRYVKMVSFSGLVNDQSTCEFVPTWGLTQGDFLSPYLFMFYVEALSA